jgi:hypothetical protein
MSSGGAKQKGFSPNGDILPDKEDLRPGNQIRYLYGKETPNEYHFRPDINPL